MSRSVSATRLEILHLTLSRKVRPQKNQRAPIMASVNIREYALIVDELRRRRGEIHNNPFPASSLTLALMEMEVGQAIVIPPKTTGAISTNRATARKRMDNPDARWSAQTLDTGYIRIVRLPDGAPNIYGKPRNPIIDQMAALNRGGRIVVQYCGGRIPGAFKPKARALMNKPSADWKYTTLATGATRVVRVR